MHAVAFHQPSSFSCHVNMHAHVCLPVCACACVHACVCVCVCVHMCECVCVCVYMCACVCATDDHELFYPVMGLHTAALEKVVTLV